MLSWLLDMEYKQNKDSCYRLAAPGQTVLPVARWAGARVLVRLQDVGQPGREELRQHEEDGVLGDHGRSVVGGGPVVGRAGARSFQYTSLVMWGSFMCISSTASSDTWRAGGPEGPRRPTTGMSPHFILKIYVCLF